MSIKNSLIKNTGYNLAGYFYLLLASFFSISILLQNLGRDVFGVYIFMASFVPLASVFEFGVSNAVIRRLSLPDLTRGERVKTWKTSFALFVSLAMILSVVVACILLFLAGSMPLFLHIDQSMVYWSIFLISLIVLVNHIDTHFLNLTQADQRFDILNTKTLLVGSANTIISAVISSFYPDIAYLFGAQLVFHVITLALMVRYSRKTFSGADFSPSYDKQTGKDLLGFGIKNFIGTLAGQVESQFSNFILGAMVSAGAITAFNIPQSIVAKGAGVVSQFAQVFFPLSASLLSKDRILKLKNLVLGLQGLIFTGGVLAVIATFSIGEVFLTWWLKDIIVVQTAFPVLKILSFYFVLVALTPIPTALVQGLNKPHIPSFFAVLTVFLEIGSALVLVPIFGALGVAYSFLFSAIITVPTFLLVSWVLFMKEITRLDE